MKMTIIVMIMKRQRLIKLSLTLLQINIWKQLSTLPIALCWSDNSTPPAIKINSYRWLQADQMTQLIPVWVDLFSGRSWHRYEIVLISGGIWKSERTLSGGVGIGVNLAAPVVEGGGCKQPPAGWRPIIPSLASTIPQLSNKASIRVRGCGCSNS